MAKQTFLNLSEDKRNMVVNALKKEFSRVPLKDALVSNIIIDAKIPRGSFYQYFNDIEDAFYYIIGEYSKDIKRKLLEHLEKNKGDIILSYILDIIESIMMTNIIQSYKRNLSKEKNKEIFERELALVCAGILKK